MHAAQRWVPRQEPETPPWPPVAPPPLPSPVKRPLQAPVIVTHPADLQVMSGTAAEFCVYARVRNPVIVTHLADLRVMADTAAEFYLYARVRTAVLVTHPADLQLMSGTAAEFCVYARVRHRVTGEYIPQSANTNNVHHTKSFSQTAIAVLPKPDYSSVWPFIISPPNHKPSGVYAALQYLNPALQPLISSPCPFICELVKCFHGCWYASIGSIHRFGLQQHSRLQSGCCTTHVFSQVSSSNLINS